MIKGSGVLANRLTSQTISTWLRNILLKGKRTGNYYNIENNNKNTNTNNHKIPNSEEPHQGLPILMFFHFIKKLCFRFALNHPMHSQTFAARPPLRNHPPLLLTSQMKKVKHNSQLLTKYSFLELQSSENTTCKGRWSIYWKMQG